LPEKTEEVHKTSHHNTQTVDWSLALGSIEHSSCTTHTSTTFTNKLVGSRMTSDFDVEYIFGFVWWGVCKQSQWRHSVTELSEDSGYVLLWQRYDNNKMVAMRYYGSVSFCCWRCVYWACYRCILHLQQYSHRLNLYYFYCTEIYCEVWTVFIVFAVLMNLQGW